ncbi:VOC family protein [Burkholderia sp. BCC0397]|uniref:VOC family protein n=1 Tax=Burkholderia sp. BCC0397 TaxID=486876 RepID=UPI001FC87F6B|nr:VOC family protein [Burkholderia sp. BCC0397]
MDITLPFRYKKLGYAAINVTDLDRSIAFYTDSDWTKAIVSPDARRSIYQRIWRSRAAG